MNDEATVRSRVRPTTVGLVVAGLVVAVLVAMQLRDTAEITDPGCEGEAAGPGGIVSLDLDTGAERWQTPTGWPTGVALSDAAVVTSSSEGIIRAFDLDTGEQLWCLETDTTAVELSGGIVGVRDVVVAAAGTDLIGLEPSSGRELWRTPLNAAEVRLGTDDDIVVVTDWSAAGGQIRTIDPKTGGELGAIAELARDAAFFGIGNPPTRLDEWSISTGPGSASDQQTIDVSVHHSGAVASHVLVPGFVAALAPAGTDITLLVLDQTGGTGDISGRVDTRLTAYSIPEGERIWQIALPGTPHVIAPITPALTVVPVGTTLYGIDPVSGEERWTIDHGSPGRAGQYTEEGSYLSIAPTSTDTAIGITLAQQAYRG